MSVFETTKFLIEFLMENPGRQYKSIDVARAIIEKYPQEAEQKRATRFLPSSISKG